MRVVKLLGASALALTVAACGSVDRLNKLAALDITGTTFNDYLARNYLDLAKWEVEQYDWIDQRIFATKGLAAAEGKTPLPENPQAWSLGPKAQRVALDARQALITLLDDGARQREPEIAAYTQVKYDCWVEQMEEAIQPKHISACESQFFEGLEELRGTVAPARLMVFFDYDSTRLGATAEAVVGDVAQIVRQRPYTRIVLTGHADRVGSNSYNLRLSKRRADAVKRALARAGVARDTIMVQAIGESEPLVPTPDGVPEPQNRRVDIAIQ